MAAAAGGTPPPPPPLLRLKDLLELDCDSCSAAGFRCYPRRLLGESPSAAAPMRHLLESPSSLSLRLRPHRRPSKLSHLSRSLSRRLSSRWSKRRQEEDENAAAAAATAASSAGSAGSSSSSEELETSSSESSSDNSSGRTNRRSRSESDSEFSSATEDSVHHHYPSPAASTAAGDEQHEVVGMKRVVSKDKDGSGSEADDKEQLSPVAVMDFPLDDDEEDDAGAACSPPSFSLARLRRRKTHKIRRFESRDDELSPLDLEARLATTSSDPDGSASASAAAVPPQQQQMIQCRTEDASRTPTTCAGSSVHDVPVPDEDDDLISLLMGTVSAGMDDDDASERLLLDFFVEMKRRRSEARAEAELPFPAGPAPADGVLRRKAERVVDNGDEAVAAAARGWLEGMGTERWGLADVLSNGAAILAEMDRDRRWMQVGVEEREVCAVVAGMLADQLVVEVVRGLFV